MRESSPTALILDDQETILELISLHLQRFGHRTIQCSSVESAIEQFGKSNGDVDLLIADVCLPDGSGVKTGVRFWELRPSLKVLFMSGYGPEGWRSDDASQLERLPEASVRILRKPFSGRELLDDIRELLRDLPQEPPSQPIGPDQEIARRQRVITALERQADLLELAHDAIIVRNLDGIIRFWNRGAENLYGWNRDDAVGRLSHDLLRTIFPVSFHEIQHALKHQGRWDGELQHSSRDGNTVIVSSRWAVRKGLDGQLEILEINRDITLQKKAEDGFRALNRELVLRVDELSRAEERFRGLLESAPEAMVISNANGEIVLVNAQTEVLFGYSRGELVGNEVDMLLPLRFRAAHAQHRQGYLANPHCRRIGKCLNLVALRKNGEEFAVEISLSPMNSAGGLLVTSAIRDTSDR